MSKKANSLYNQQGSAQTFTGQKLTLNIFSLKKMDGTEQHKCEKANHTVRLQKGCWHGFFYFHEINGSEHPKLFLPWPLESTIVKLVGLVLNYEQNVIQWDDTDLTMKRLLSALEYVEVHEAMYFANTHSHNCSKNWERDSRKFQMLTIPQG